MQSNNIYIVIMLHYPLLNVLLFILLLLYYLPLIDIELVSILEQLIYIVYQVSQMLFKYRTAKNRKF